MLIITSPCCVKDRIAEGTVQSTVSGRTGGSAGTVDEYLSSADRNDGAHHDVFAGTCSGSPCGEGPWRSIGNL
jgi:hypothetical protein